MRVANRHIASMTTILQEGGTVFRGKTARVLIVGGEPLLGTTVRNALTEQAYNVDTIESLEEAGSVLRDDQYDVVITIQRAPDPAQVQVTLPVLAHPHLTIEQLERAHILNVLANVRGHRGRAAEILGIDRRTLYRKLKEYQRDGARHKAPSN